jgi:hypothetical protein
MRRVRGFRRAVLASNLRHALRSRQKAFSSASIAHVMKHKERPSSAGTGFHCGPSRKRDPWTAITRRLVARRGATHLSRQCFSLEPASSRTLPSIFHAPICWEGAVESNTVPPSGQMGVFELQKHFDSYFTIKLRPMHNDVKP